MLKITEIKKEEAVQALELIHEVYREIPEKSWFSLDGDKELLGYMTGTGFALKAVEEREVAECRCKEGTFEVAEEEAVEKKSEMAAVFIARTTDLAEENLGEYLRLTFGRNGAGCTYGNCHGTKSVLAGRECKSG